MSSLKITPRIRRILADTAVIREKYEAILQSHVPLAQVWVESHGYEVVHSTERVCPVFSGGVKETRPAFSATLEFGTCSSCCFEVLSQHAVYRNAVQLLRGIKTSHFSSGVSAQALQTLFTSFLSTTTLLHENYAEDIPQESAVMVAWAKEYLPLLSLLLLDIAKQYPSRTNDPVPTGLVAVDLKGLSEHYVDLNPDYFTLDYANFANFERFRHRNVIVVENPYLFSNMAAYTAPIEKCMSVEEVDRSISFMHDGMSFADAVHTAQSI